MKLKPWKPAFPSSIKSVISSKVKKWGLLVLTIVMLSVCFIACSDKKEVEEDFSQIELNQVENQNLEAPTLLTSPATTKWIKKKADRFDDLINILDDYYHIPSGSIADLDWCEERESVALYSGIDYDLLTVATDLASIQLAGISLDHAKILQGGMWLGIDQGGYRGLGIVDQISKRNSLDASTLSALNPINLELWITDFVNNYCIDCTPSDLLSLNDIQVLITAAGNVSPYVSYNDLSGCLRTDGIKASPGNTKWVKKKTD